MSSRGREGGRGGRGGGKGKREKREERKEEGGYCALCYTVQVGYKYNKV